MTEIHPEHAIDFAELTSGIVAAYVCHNSVALTDLTKLIVDTHAALRGISNAADPAPTPAPVPAVPVKKSITPDYLICLDDGMKFKSLKRHLRTHYNMTPDDYRQKWGLPADYPMVAPSYAEKRSSLAKANGLGRKAPAEPASKPARKKIGLAL